jgi:radical SAM superfamily enzyme YgiQ (UPF0313 family)
MKLLLVNPAEKEALGWSDLERLRSAPLGLAYVAALTPREWEITIADENFGPFEPQDADLVGITSFTCNARRAYEVASMYRQERVPVVMGGMHASAVPDEALQYVDCVVVGEADGVWNRVVEDFEAGTLQKVYPGPRVSCTGLVKPRRELLDPRYRMASVQTSRGCPFDCEFCTVTQFFGRSHRLRPAREVLDELESIPQAEINIVDDNVGGSGQRSFRRARELFKGMIDRRLGKRWSAQASVNLLKDLGLMRLASESGCVALFFGVESVSPVVLREMNKAINLGETASTYKRGFRELQRLGITSTAGFVVGNDSDTEETLEAIECFAEETGVDVLQVSLLTPFPGTRLYRRIQDEGRLILDDYPEDWRYYDFGTLVFETKLAPGVIIERIRRLMSRNLTTPAIMRRTARNFARSGSLRSAIVCFTINRVYRQLYSTGTRERWQGMNEALLRQRSASRRGAQV